MILCEGLLMMFKKLQVPAIFSFLIFSILIASEKNNTIRNEMPDGCTSIIAGRLASADGSTITSHTCDGYSRTWVAITPHLKHEAGAKAKIYNREIRRTEFPTDMRELKVLGEIPQVEETFAFVNTAYPSMNEHQLGIGESTIGGRPELRSEKGIFLIEELEKIVLQRTTTAKDAIRMMGELVKEYGYCDTGECLTIIDPKEAWYFEIFGPGKGRFGAVWAAVRIPDNHVGVSANVPRIAEININDTDNYMASENVFSLAEEKCWWNAKDDEPFKFWKAYSGRKPFSIREFWILNSLAPSLGLEYNAEELPLSVEPDKKISVWDVMHLLGANYEGSWFDMTKNLKVKDKHTGVWSTSPAANPWMSKSMMELLNTLKPGAIERNRTVALNTCAYSTVIQSRGWLPDAVGGILWLNFDNPGLTPRVPIFAGVTELPPEYHVSSQKRFRRDCAAWAFHRASRLAQITWGRDKEVIRKAVKHFEERAVNELPAVERKAVDLFNRDPVKAKEYLTAYSNDFARAMVHKYWELGDELWVNYTRGF